MKDTDIINALGGTSYLAKILDIAPASVSEWRVKGIPKDRKQTLSLLFPKQTPKEWRPVIPKKARS